MHAIRRSKFITGRGLRALVAGLTAVIVISLVPPPAASAHAQYDHSTPAADAVVRVAPTRVDVWFTQELFKRAGANGLQVTGSDGTRVDTAQNVVDDVDRTHLSVELMPELAPGVYAVHWTSLSAADGDAAEGDFSFTFDPNASAEGMPSTPVAATSTEVAASSTPSPAASNSEGTPFPWWAVISAAAILGAGAATAWAIQGGGGTEGGSE